MTDHASGSTYFSSHDRRRLANTLKRTSDVRLFRRVQAVLHVAEGDPIRSVARLLRSRGRSVQRWVEVYRCRRQPEDLLDAQRSGRPRAAGELDQAALAQVLAQDPRTLGYRATTWTTPLLATHLNRECGCPVSERTLRRRLQEGGWRWKRPRYVFSERDIAIGQKKGAFAAD
jgi:transposase